MKKILPDNLSKLAFVMKGLYSSSRYRMLRHILRSYYPADLVLAFKEDEPKDILDILRVADQKIQVNIFQYFSLETQLSIIPLLQDFEIYYYFEHLPADERTNLLREMDEKTRNKILDEISEKERTMATNLLSYHEDTAGSIVTYAATIYEDYTIQQTLDHIRAQSSSLEDIHNIYVLDEEEHLIGVLSIEQLIFTDPKEFVSNIMHTEPMYINASQSKEDAVQAIQKYDITSLPVVDENRKILGIITYDDAMDILIQQGTENIYRFAGVKSSDNIQETYLEQPILDQVKRRFTWTIIPIFMEIITGFVIGRAEALLQTVFILATFIPMIAAAGGNIGSQSASLITRAIALKEIGFKDIFRVLRRELMVSFIIAIICGSILVLKMILFPHVPTSGLSFSLIILTVSLALILQLIMSALLGSFVPLLAVKLNIDPAIMSSPVLASSVDIIGLLIFFSLAKLILF